MLKSLRQRLKSTKAKTEKLIHGKSEIGKAESRNPD
jgi:hypothetical protein